MDQKPKPIHEFLLWNTCNNHCKFCHQKANRHKYPEKFPNSTGKIQSIKKCIKFILENLHDESHLLFMGGELFDEMDPEVEHAFGHLITMVESRMIFGKTDILYFNTNLLYSDLGPLERFLNQFKDMALLHRLRMTTSYDIGYRFATIEDRFVMQANMQYISSKYPELSRVANYILTDKGTAFLLEHPEFLKEFELDYEFRLNPIPYIVLMDSQAATRTDVLKVLKLLENTYPGYLQKMIDGQCSEQKRYLWEYNGAKYVDACSGNAECGHNVNFRRVYKQDSHCFLCDCKKLLSIL